MLVADNADTSAAHIGTRGERVVLTVYCTDKGMWGPAFRIEGSVQPGGTVLCKPIPRQDMRNAPRVVQASSVLSCAMACARDPGVRRDAGVPHSLLAEHDLGGFAPWVSTVVQQAACHLRAVSSIGTPLALDPVHQSAETIRRRHETV